MSEVCQAIWRRMGHLYMKVPTTADEWLLISANFEATWNFPHCMGAIDGKHVVMKAPPNSGSLYFNYKSTFSTVLMAVVDANLRFIAIDVGAYGRNSDGGIFANSNLGKATAKNALNFPEDAPLPTSGHLGPVPYVFVADEAFPLQRHLMRPFPGRGCTEEQKIYNYRLSRARRIVENAFGILAARWRVYHSKLAVRPEWVTEIIKATCVLHNVLQAQSTPAQVTTLIKETGDTCPDGLQDFTLGGNRAGRDALKVRNIFKEYFSDRGSVPWQLKHVQRGIFTE